MAGPIFQVKGVDEIECAKLAAQLQKLVPGAVFTHKHPRDLGGNWHYIMVRPCTDCPEPISHDEVVDADVKLAENSPIVKRLQAYVASPC